MSKDVEYTNVDLQASLCKIKEFLLFGARDPFRIVFNVLRFGTYTRQFLLPRIINAACCKWVWVLGAGGSRRISSADCTKGAVFDRAGCALLPSVCSAGIGHRAADAAASSDLEAAGLPIHDAAPGLARCAAWRSGALPLRLS